MNKLAKEEEKNNQFETNINGEIANRIGEILRQKIELDQQIVEIKATMKSKDEEIEDLYETIQEHEKELRIELNEHNDTKEKLEFANTQIKLMKEKVSVVQSQMQDKLHEIDKLMDTGDYLRAELRRITTNYDFDSIDKDKRLLQKYRVWAVNMNYYASRVGPMIDSFFKCGLCSNLAIEAVVVEPCNHVFCSKCLKN